MKEDEDWDANSKRQTRSQSQRSARSTRSKQAPRLEEPELRRVTRSQRTEAYTKTRREPLRARRTLRQHIEDLESLE